MNFLTLSEDDLFQAAAPSFGQETLALDFAGGPYSVTGLDHAQKKLLTERYGDLVSRTKGAEALHIPVKRLESHVFRKFDQRGWVLSLDLKQAADRIRVIGPGYASTFDYPVRSAKFYFRDLPEDEFFGAFENLFRASVAYRLLEKGGLLLHSAGLASMGQAYVFFGHSGAGKTTVTRMSANIGKTVLSDDLNAVSLAEDGQVTVEQVPFAGDFGGNNTARMIFPLSGLLRIVQAKENRLEDLRPAQMLAALTASSPFVNSDPYRTDALMENIQKLVGRVPCKTLHFSLDGKLWSRVGEMKDGNRAAG